MKLDLRAIPTDVLQRELRDRGRCLDCKTAYSRGWFPAGTERIRCFNCQAKRRLVERRQQRERTPLLHADGAS